MPRCIVKCEGKYFEWSTVVDAPVSEPKTLEAFKAEYRRRFGSEGFKDSAARLARVEATGTSSHDGSTFESLVSCNRFGPNETEMSLEDLKAWVRGENR